MTEWFALVSKQVKFIYLAYVIREAYTQRASKHKARKKIMRDKHILDKNILQYKGVCSEGVVIVIVKYGIIIILIAVLFCSSGQNHHRLNIYFKKSEMWDKRQRGTLFVIWCFSEDVFWYRGTALLWQAQSSLWALSAALPSSVFVCSRSYCYGNSNFFFWTWTFSVDDSLDMFTSPFLPSWSINTHIYSINVGCGENWQKRQL